MDEALYEAVQYLQARLQRRSKPLTEMQILDVADALNAFPPNTRCSDIVLFARAIESAHGVIDDKAES